MSLRGARLEATRAELAGAGEANLLQRILLVTDGTVTHMLEAYAREPIRVVKLHQSIEPCTDDLPDLELDRGHDVMRREVLLQGSRSGHIFIHAVSRIVPDRLDDALRRGLEESTKPIGLLLEESRTETFREILTSSREPAGSSALHFGIDPAAALISRSYRVISGGRPIMLITERFPAASLPIGADETIDGAPDIGGTLEVDGRPADGGAD
ncbi:MAG TPA: chorismate pyruvate-lyase family protein [Candidatus Dormibacteraeota bacterium]|nr:chorismate pyruvate-lyase family protein [Candidatus Dormibacteraeota bacterium]